MELFEYQKSNVAIYGQWINSLGRSVDSICDIPFLPISLFKSHRVFEDGIKEDAFFLSSGTSQTNRSKHYIDNVDRYIDNAVAGFNQFYGDVSQYCFLALVPNYMDRKESSLIYMIDRFIALTKHRGSGYFLNDISRLYDQIIQNQTNGVKTILWGVSYALLDFIEQYQLHFPELIVMETGGMKGRRAEMTKAALHELLMKGFGVSSIHSEYGMTELLSQAYSRGGGIYHTASTMKVKLMEIEDPLTEINIPHKTGVINIIDLANVHSCAFIATQDMGRLHPCGGFEIMGRLHASDLRGCNLLIE